MKKVIGIILIIVISLFILTGCTSEATETTTKYRFKEIIDDGAYEVVCDTETKVLYLQSCRGSGYQGYGGLTVLVDAEGKPLLYEGE